MCIFDILQKVGIFNTLDAKEELFSLNYQAFQEIKLFPLDTQMLLSFSFFYALKK
jgi:hypothetical protein